MVSWFLGVVSPWATFSVKRACRVQGRGLRSPYKSAGDSGFKGWALRLLASGLRLAEAGIRFGVRREEKGERRRGFRAGLERRGSGSLNLNLNLNL